MRACIYFMHLLLFHNEFIVLLSSASLSYLFFFHLERHYTMQEGGELILRLLSRPLSLHNNVNEQKLEQLATEGGGGGGRRREEQTSSI